MSDERNTVADLPWITVAEIQGMGEGDWENLLDRIERENRPFLLRDEVRGRDCVIMPHALWCEMKARAGAPVIDQERTSSDDRFSDIFRDLRGRLSPDHDLEI